MVPADTAFYDRILTQAVLSSDSSRKRVIVELDVLGTAPFERSNYLRCFQPQPTAHFQSVVQAAAREHGTHRKGVRFDPLDSVVWSETNYLQSGKSQAGVGASAGEVLR